MYNGSHVGPAFSVPEVRRTLLMIAIVNYDMGNLDSVARAFRQCGAEAVLTSNPEEIERAAGVVLPGVGFFDEAMRNLKEGGLDTLLTRRALEERVPFLGICLGFQMFTKHSEEGDAPGLGWIDGVTRRFRFDDAEEPLKVPHMGWNELSPRKDSPLLEGIAPDSCFYFAHSYCVFCEEEDAVLATTSYGTEFVSAVARDNLFGVQFHPEKSHRAGLQMIANFTGMTRHA